MDSKLIIPTKKGSKLSVSMVMLSFTAVVVMFVGLFLLSVTIWSFARKMFVYTFFMEIHVDTTFFSIPAGLLCMPSVFLTLLLKSNKLRYMLALIGIQMITTTLLFTGYFMGMVYKLDYSNETVHLSSTIPREALNNTLYTMIANYKESSENNSAVDHIQQKFACCGIDSKDDFIEVPDSCCLHNDCKKNDVWSKGCLRIIQEDVAWHTNITSSLTQLFILMYFFNISMVLSVYISDHYKWRKIKKTKERQKR